MYKEVEKGHVAIEPRILTWGPGTGPKKNFIDHYSKANAWKLAPGHYFRQAHKDGKVANLMDSLNRLSTPPVALRVKRH